MFRVSILKICHTALLVVFVLLLAGTAFGQVEYGSFVFDGHTRNYIVFLPQNYEPGVPLVLNLHGYDMTAQEEMEYTLMNEVADTANFVVAYPDAINRRWNSGLGDNPRWPTPKVDDVAFLSALIDTLHSNYSIDLDKVYTCGWSNGGFMSFKLACQLSYRIAGAASVGGVLSTGMVAKCTSSGGIPILFIHGTADPIVPYESLAPNWYSAEETVKFWVELNNCSVQADTVSLPDIDLNDGCTFDVISYTGSTNKGDVVFYKILNGGHHWPGGVPCPPSWHCGVYSSDINTASEIWRFFNTNRNN